MKIRNTIMNSISDTDTVNFADLIYKNGWMHKTE